MTGVPGFICPVVLFLASAAASTFAHSSGLDEFGCQSNHRAGDYHCHRGRFAGTTFGSKAEMLRRTGAQQSKPAPTTAPELPSIGRTWPRLMWCIMSTSGLNVASYSGNRG